MATLAPEWEQLHSIVGGRTKRAAEARPAGTGVAPPGPRPETQFELGEWARPITERLKFILESSMRWRSVWTSLGSSPRATPSTWRTRSWTSRLVKALESRQLVFDKYVKNLVSRPPDHGPVFQGRGFRPDPEAGSDGDPKGNRARDGDLLRRLQFPGGCLPRTLGARRIWHPRGLGRAADFGGVEPPGRAAMNASQALARLRNLGVPVPHPRAPEEVVTSPLAVHREAVSEMRRPQPRRSAPARLAKPTAVVPGPTPTIAIDEGPPQVRRGRSAVTLTSRESIALAARGFSGLRAPMSQIGDATA